SAHGRHALEIIDRPGVRRTRTRDHREGSAGIGAIERRFERPARDADAPVRRRVPPPATRHRAGPSPPRAIPAAWRAATSADRLPAVPPETKQPPDPAGMRASPASHPSTWFSAHTAPPPSSQLPPERAEAG